MATAASPLLFSLPFLDTNTRKGKKKAKKLQGLTQILSGLQQSDPNLFAQLTVNGALNPAIPQDILKRLASGKGLKTKQLLKLQLLNIGMPSAQFEFDKTKKLFDLSFPELQKMLSEGFSPEELAAMNSQAIEGTATQFGGAREALATELSRRGLRTGAGPISGEGLRRTAELGGAQAISTSQALRDVILQNAQARRENRVNALNLASGFPASPSTALGANTALGGTIAQLQALEPGSLAASLGASLGGALIGTGFDFLSGQLNKKKNN